MRERPSVVSDCKCNSRNIMSFLDIKDTAKRMALIDEYVKAMKTVRRRERKLAIGKELQILFHPIVNATKQAAEKTAEELVPVKKALEDIDGALRAQKQHTAPAPPLPPQKDLTFGIHATGDGRHAMGNSTVHIEGNIPKVDDKVYELTPGLRVLIMYKKPRPQHYTSDDYSVYKAIVAQTRVRAYPNKRIGSARPRSTWKWKHMFKGMVIPGDVVEEDDSTDDSRAPSLRELIRSRPVTVAPHPLEDYMFRPIDAPGPSAGKARKKRKPKEPFYKGYGVVYLPGDIKGLTDKLHLLLEEFLAGNTTVRNEQVYELDVLLRLTIA